MNLRPSLLLSASFILSFSLFCGSLKACDTINKEDQPPTTNQVAQLFTSDLPDQDSGNNKRKRGKKGKETSKAFDTSSNSSSSTSSTKKQKSERPSLQRRVIGILTAALPPHMQDEALQFIVQQHIGLTQQGKLNETSFNEIIDSCAAVLPAQKQDETLTSFKARLFLSNLLEQNIQALEQNFIFEQARIGFRSKQAEVESGDSRASQLHLARQKLIQFYINTLRPARVTTFVKNTPFGDDQMLYGKEAGGIKRQILILYLKLEKLVAITHSSRANELTLEDYQLFGQAYDSMIKISLDGGDHINYRLKATEMYSSMLELLKENATAKHLKLIAPHYEKIGELNAIAASKQENPNYSKAIEAFNKAGEYYAKIIELLGEKVAAKHYEKAGECFNRVADSFEKKLDDAIAEQNDDAIKEATNKTIEYYLRALPFYYAMLAKIDDDVLKLFRFKDYMLGWKTAEKFLRKHHESEKADQYRSLIRIAKHLIRTSPIFNNLDSRAP